jgi:hypothetical protein
MKFNRLFLGILSCISFLVFTNSAKSQQVSVSVGFQVFYDELSPYGTWVDNPQYGYVWLPNVGVGFQPYSTNGYWIYTNDGWTWVSNYSWGWAPFHYGRWYDDGVYGPMWIPDNEWGPGWVNWRQSEGYYGWAPMGPGISYSMTIGENYHVPYNQWTFVHSHDFGRKNLNHYYVNSNENVTIINNTTVINNSRLDNVHHVNYNAGPDREDVEKKFGEKITPVEIRANDKPGEKFDNNQLHLYKPEVQKNIDESTKPAPARVTSIKELKPQIHKDETTPLLPKSTIANHQATPAKQEINKQPKQNIQPKRNLNHSVSPIRQQQPSPDNKVPAAKHNTPNIQPHQLPHRNTPTHQDAPLLQQNPPQQHQAPTPGRSPMPQGGRNPNQQPHKK